MLAVHEAGVAFALVVTLDTYHLERITQWQKIRMHAVQLFHFCLSPWERGAPRSRVSGAVKKSFACEF